MSVTFLLPLLLRHHAEAVCVCVRTPVGNEYEALNPHVHIYMYRLHIHTHLSTGIYRRAKKRQGGGNSCEIYLGI